MVALVNLGAEPFAVTRGMRIAQLVFARVEPAAFREVGSLPADRTGARADSGAPGELGGLTLRSCPRCYGHSV